jgi:predicted component of type VI protein secretion system
MLSLKLVGGADRAEGVRLEMRMPSGQTVFSIGRDPGCDWALPDRSLALSARHCEIQRTGAGLVLHDLSTNGSFVNGATARLAAPHLLHDGDRITLGPYVVLVGLHAGAGVGLEHADASPAPLPVPSPAVDDTAVVPLLVQRGRDPAAVDIGHLGLPAGDDLGLTRIRPPPKPAAVPAPPQPVVPAPVAAAHLLLPDRLAAGLGLPPQALVGHDAADLAEQTGAIARAAVEGLRRLLEQQARARRRIGSRRQAMLRGASPLRLAQDTDAALLALLAAPGGAAAPVVQACAEIVSHQDQLLDACRSATQRLGDELSPAALAQAVAGADGDARKARLWDLYVGLWSRLGVVSEDTPWPAGLMEAALLHLAAAYDETPPA